MQAPRILLFTTLTLILLASCTMPACADPYLGGIPLETVREGQVSGGLFVDAQFPMSNDGSASFLLPANTAIQWARLYVVVYSGHMQNNYQAQAEVTFNGGRGSSTLATVLLNVPYTFPGEGGSGPVRLNDHTTRVTSDYLMWYDVKNQIQDRNVQARVRTTRPAGYTGTFDGRVKAIVLVAAYEDGDQDRVFYWVNQGHDEDSERTEEMLGETYIGETSFSTSSLDDEWERADLTVVHLASENAEYEFNRDSLAAGKPQGAYAGIDRHDVTDSIRKGRDSDLTYDNTGRFYKIMLATLAVRYPGSNAGSVKVTSSPTGATIYLDGEEQEALTNATIAEVSPGYHTVSVEKEGFRPPPVQAVNIQTGVTSTVHFVLEQGKGTISVTSEPPGAEVLVDGVKHTALTPCVIRDVPAGNREVMIRLSGYQDWKDTFDVLDGETVMIEADLSLGGKAGLSSGGSSGGTSSAAHVDNSGYRGGALALYRQGTLNGTLFWTVAGDYTGLIPAGQKKVFTLPEKVPIGGEFVLSRLYLYTTWSHDTSQREGVPASPSVSWNGKLLNADATYTDRKGEGIYDYPVETFAYDLKGVISPGEKGEVVVENRGARGREFAAYGVMLIAVLKNSTAPQITYWVCEGSDIVYADPRFGTTAEDSRTSAGFPGELEKEDLSGARLLLVSTAASGEGGDQHQVVFNDGEWYNPLTGGSSGVSTAELDVLPWLSRSGNVLEIVSLPVSGKGDYMENRNAVLLLARGVHEVMAGEAPGDLLQGPSAPGTTSPAMKEAENPPVSQEEGRVTASPTASHIPPPRRGSIVENIIEWVFACLFDVFRIDVPSPAGPPGGIAPGTSGVAVYAEQGSDTADEGIDPAGSLHGQDPVATSAGEGREGAQSGPASPVPVVAEPDTSPGQKEKVVTGGVFIDSYPRGATIYIDGRQIPAKTPFVANWLKAGMHTIRVSMESFTFTPDSRQVWVIPGEIAIAEFANGVSMVRRIALNSTEWAGAQCTVNGRGPVLRLPAEVSMEGIAPFVTVYADQSWYSQTIPARIDDGSEVILTRTEGGLGGLEVLSMPPGAQVSIDGFNTGKVTPALIGNLSPGQHRVDLILPGHYPSSQVVTLVDYPSEQEDMVINVSLNAYLFGNLSLDSNPPGAKISMFNKDTGKKTPSTFEYLSIGTVQGKVRWDDAERDFEVDVLPGRTVSLTLSPPGRQ